MMLTSKISNRATSHLYCWKLDHFCPFVGAGSHPPICHPPGHPYPPTSPSQKSPWCSTYPGPTSSLCTSSSATPPLPPRKSGLQDSRPAIGIDFLPKPTTLSICAPPSPHRVCRAPHDQLPGTARIHPLLPGFRICSRWQGGSHARWRRGEAGRACPPSSPSACPLNQCLRRSILPK